MPDTVTLTLDAEQYHREIARLTAQNQRLSRSGEEIGRGFLRGDRAVRVATQNITSGLLSATNATDAALIAMQSLERVFRIPIGATIGVAAGVAIFSVLYSQIKKTEAAGKDLREELGKSIDLRLQGNVQSLAGSIEKLTTKIAALRKEMNSPTQKFIDLFEPNQLPQGIGGTLGGIKAGIPPGQKLSPEVKELISAEKQLDLLESERAKREVKMAEAKRDENKFAQASVEYESKRADLFQGAFKAGLSMVDLMKRLIALQIDYNAQISQESNARHQTVVDAEKKFVDNSRNFFLDLHRGKFTSDFLTRTQENVEIRQGQLQLENAIDMKRRGFQSPLLDAMIDAGEKIGKQSGQGLQHLMELDFSNLDPLSKYDFSGLAPLDGLTIVIQ